MLDGYAINSVPGVSDHKSRNDSGRVKSCLVDLLKKLSPDISKSVLFHGYNVNIDGLLFDGNASKSILMLFFS
jgi:hypothetical protein